MAFDAVTVTLLLLLLASCARRDALVTGRDVIDIDTGVVPVSRIKTSVLKSYLFRGVLRVTVVCALRIIASSAGSS